MFIEHIIVKNYKKLKHTKLSMKPEHISNVLIGPNNSGKTSVIEAISKFLSEHGNLRLFDLPLANWSELNKIFDLLNSARKDINKEEEFTTKYEEFKNLLPSLKCIFKYQPEELPFVKYFLPDLDITEPVASFTILYEPKDIHKLLDEYDKYILEKQKLITNESLDEDLTGYYWPGALKGFMEFDDNFNRYFSFKSYISNPFFYEKISHFDKEDEQEQLKQEAENRENSDQVEFPYDDITNINVKYVYRLIRVDTVAAGRYLGDVDDKGQSIDLTEKNIEKESVISKLLTEYANKDTLDTQEEKPLLTELEKAVVSAKYNTEQQLKQFYEEVLTDLIRGFSDLGYPGLHSPDIIVSPKVEHSQSLKKEASILLSADMHSGRGLLPESYNGLGYRQLLYIYLKIKSYIEIFNKNKKEGKSFYHILLVEEPEANLHGPVQKVLIKEIENMMPKREGQIIMSTHSNHILDLMKFDQLHYLSAEKNTTSIKYLLQHSLVRNSVGENNDRFLQKYFELHSHDIFYADGIILVEGQSERILIPHYIRNCHEYKELNRKYIAIINVGGAYAHKFFPLFELLGKPVLLITDLDSLLNKKSPVIPKSMSEQKSTNSVINKFFLKELSVKDLIEKRPEDKMKSNINTRLAYQYENHASGDEGVYARTFEDAFALRNKDKFKSLDFKEDYKVRGRGLLKEFKEVFLENEEVDFAAELFKKIEDNKKADFALDIIHYLTHENDLDITAEFHLPYYIHEGLLWLNNEMRGETSER